MHRRVGTSGGKARPMARWGRPGLAALAWLVLWATPSAAVDPDALWKIVHERCAVSPAPCARVDAQEHYALLKDLVGASQFLLLPTDRITGLEDPVLYATQWPNYFALAWRNRDLVAAKLAHPVPRDVMSLAVNAQTVRSQNQLHIHMDCLGPAAHDALKAAAPSLGAAWTALPDDIAGHRFTARRVDGADLDGFDPIRAVGALLADPAGEMRRRNIVVVGADFAEGPGFIVLTDEVPGTVPGGGGEDLQDHGCALAR